MASSLRRAKPHREARGDRRGARDADAAAVGLGEAAAEIQVRQRVAVALERRDEGNDDAVADAAVLEVEARERRVAAQERLGGPRLGGRARRAGAVGLGLVLERDVVCRGHDAVEAAAAVACCRRVLVSFFALVGLPVLALAAAGEVQVAVAQGETG